MAVNAFLFPGPGAAEAGMGMQLYNVALPLRASFDFADKLMQPLGVKPSKACFVGPDAELKKSSYAGPALLALTQGLVEFFKQKRVTFQMVAGQGFGEICALVAANILTFEEGLLFLRKRGEILEAAWAKAPFFVCTQSGLPVEELEARFKPLARRPEVVAYHSPDACTLAGEEGLLKRIMPLLASKQVKVGPVEPGMAWPHPSFAEAAVEVAAEFSRIKWQRSGTRELHSSTRGEWVADLGVLADLQRELCVAPIRWDKTLRSLFARGANTVVELGHGQNLVNYARKVDNGIRALPAEDSKSLSLALKLAN